MDNFHFETWFRCEFCDKLHDKEADAVMCCKDKIEEVPDSALAVELFVCDVCGNVSVDGCVEHAEREDRDGFSSQREYENWRFR